MIKTDRQLIQGMIDRVRELCAPVDRPGIHASMLIERVFDCKPISQPHNRNLAKHTD
jgi:hypothetical protein